MSEEVGQIQLDVVTNRKQFQKEMSGITGIAKKAGKVLAGAFAVKQIVDFGKECLQLGSDLSEVQNVVDVTFPKMKAQVNDFAKSAAASFGLSETMAKKYTGAFGAMAKSFGFTEKEAYNMSTTLTGLAGDVASFYNLSQDEAYTKLKSVFTGETESLKDLGVVMTQSALDSFALANGFSKTTKEMSEQEKVALRYKFVMQQLSAANGDFLRTSDSWANQTRLLSLQFDSLKASIGQGLINAFTPVLKVINTLMGKLTALAAKFAELTGQAFGQQDTSGTQAGMDGIANSADDAAGAVSGIGDATKKAAKEAQRATMSFDKINKLSGNSDSGTGAGADIGGGNAGGKSDAATKKSSGALDQLRKKFKACQKLFAQGFKLGAGNISGAVASIKNHLKSIGSSLTEIFTDKNVGASFKKMVALFSVNAGKVTGALASIGATIADNVLGGIDIFLQGNKERIKSWLVNMFDISGQTGTIVANFTAAVAEIFSVFRGGDAKKITSDLITLLYNSFAGTTELFSKMGRDIINLITQPITDNKDKFKTAIENVIAPVSKVIGKIAETSTETWNKIQELYDSKVKPLIDSLAEGISGWISTFLDAYNEHMAPVLDRLSKKFTEVMDNKVKPAIDVVIDAFGKACDAIKAVWENWLQPLVDWCIENIVPAFAAGFEEAGNIINEAIGKISDVIKGVSTAFSGVCTLIEGIASGDWKKAWNGVKNMLKGIWDAIKNVFSLAWTGIKMIFSPAGKFFDGVWDAVKKPFSSVTTWFKDKFSEAWQKVKDVFSTGGKIFSGIKSGITDMFKTIVNKLISGINTVITEPFKNINGMLNKIRDVGIGKAKPFSKLWAKNPLTIPQIPALATGGYVKKNTPQLAMIGDNRHQGEVVAPENKLLEMARQAAALSSEFGMTSKVLALLERIIELLEALDLCITMDGEVVTKKIVRNINRHTKQTGRCEIDIR